MLNIQNSPYPLVFEAANDGIAPGPAALPPEHIQVHTTARALEGMQKEAIVEYPATAILTRSPASACLRDELPGTFAIDKNGEALAPREQAAAPVAIPDPAAAFDNLRPVIDAPTMADIITKSGQDSISVAGKADPVGLQANQNRILHVRAQGQLRDDGIKAITARCVQPASTAFTFLSDVSKAVGGQERAPSGLAYLSCGVAFCFMTQLGRYAQIAKQRLNGYRIVQETGFGLAQAGEASANPVKTQAFIDTDEDEQATRKLVEMGEQTCYLHASYRQSIPIRVKFTN